jgi:Reverse transcriptase (RNA-dependent DNA polymerase)
VWADLGASEEVLNIIQHGVVPQMVSECLPYDMGSLTLEGVELQAWLELEHKYLSMGAFVRDDNIQWINNCFLFPKASGGFRLIVDNRPFNEHNVEYPTELDTLHTLSSALCPGDFLSAFDLQDGYFHLAIHEDYQKYFGFRVNGVGYRMVAAPFGWSGSPQAFMIFTRAIGTMLERAVPLHVDGEIFRAQSIRHRILIDDFLLMFGSEIAANEGVRYTKRLLALLGVGVNESKSSWTPEHVKQHLGLTIDTVQCMFYVPPEKLGRIRDCAKLLLSEVARHARWVPARTLARLCGLVMCISLAFKGAHFFTRYIFDALKLKTSWGAKVKLSNMALKHVKFFSKLHQLWNGKKIWPAQVTRKLEVDASDLGWAAKSDSGKQAHGHWDAKGRKQHIMTRECLAVYHGLSTFVEEYSGQAVDVVCDNAAVVYGLDKFTSRSPQLMQIVGQIFWLCHRKNIQLVPRLIPSAMNVVDALSRRTASDEWSIAAWLFRQIEGLWGPHDLDRFASHACHVLPRYNSLFWDPLTEGVDALQQDWRGVNNYVHPPVHLLPHVVRKLRRLRGVSCSIVAPDWPGQPWYLQLMMMAKSVRVVPAGVFAFHRLGSDGGRVPLQAKWPVLLVRVER